MKSTNMLIISAIISSLSGCTDTMFNDNSEEQKARRLQAATTACCNATAYESGYYYNGYQENGWRYCVIQKDPRDQ